MQAAFRELQHANTRKRLLELEEQLKESEHRNELLMSESQDAVAFVADGMVINVNGLFAERFAYTEADDMDCLPVIDLIDASDQDIVSVLSKQHVTAVTSDAIERDVTQDRGSDQECR